MAISVFPSPRLYTSQAAWSGVRGVDSGRGGGWVRPLGGIGVALERVEIRGSGVALGVRVSAQETGVGIASRLHPRQLKVRTALTPQSKIRLIAFMGLKYALRWPGVIRTRSLALSFQVIPESRFFGYHRGVKIGLR